jgi:diphthamide biosynthesis methyltransferase
MKNIFLVLIVLFSTPSIAQTVTQNPIYKGANSLTVQELNDKGYIYFGFQNIKYTAIIDIESFLVDNKSDAIKLMKEGLAVLEMDKTSKDQHINHSFGELKIVRYGFSQKTIYFDSKLRLIKRDMEKIISALENYEDYRGEQNKE